MEGIIFDIKKFAVHDGDGIRTTVFLKGCPLKCVWCHNPEGISAKKCLAFYSHKCVNCGACCAICPCHKFENNIHSFDNTDCVACGKCVKMCSSEALHMFGKAIDVDELMPILLEDKAFYDNSNGGITLSGGECLLQPDFCSQILKECKKYGINTAIDTSGAVPYKSFEKVIDYTDVFLYDLKAFDEAVHIRCTGITNELILENLKRIDALGKKTEIRIPYVPLYNDDQMDKIADFILKLKNVISVRILPYHDFARSKYNSLLIPDTMPIQVPSDEEILHQKSFLKEKGINIL